MRGLAFFFGLAFIIEVGLILVFGVDQRMVEAAYIGQSLALGDMRIPMRMLVAFGVALVLTAGLDALSLAHLHRAGHQGGGAGRAGAAADGREPGAHQAMGVRHRHRRHGARRRDADHRRPVEPGLDRLYIGRTFCVVVLAGLGSMTGTLAAGLILGISESIVLMLFGASWAPAVAFGLLLIVLGIRPQGLFGR